MSSFKPGDSVSFLLKYNEINNLSNKVDFRRFLHGGTIIFGVIDNYDREKNKYLADSTTYFLSNQHNYLYDIMRRVITYEDNKPKHSLVYSILKSNTTNKIVFKWDFLKLE